MTGGLAPFDRTRQLDGPAEQQQFFGERGLAGIGMGNDGKCASAGEFGQKFGHGCRFSMIWGRVPGVIGGSGA